VRKRTVLILYLPLVITYSEGEGASVCASAGKHQRLTWMY